MSWFKKHGYQGPARFFTPRVVRDWRTELGLMNNAHPSPKDVRDAHRTLVKQYRALCPDATHPDERIINNARDQALEDLAASA